MVAAVPTVAHIHAVVHHLQDSARVPHARLPEPHLDENVHAHQAVHQENVHHPHLRHAVYLARHLHVQGEDLRQVLLPLHVDDDDHLASLLVTEEVVTG